MKFCPTQLLVEKNSWMTLWVKLDVTQKIGVMAQRDRSIYLFHYNTWLSLDWIQVLFTSPDATFLYFSPVEKQQVQEEVRLERQHGGKNSSLHSFSALWLQFNVGGLMDTILIKRAWWQLSWSQLPCTLYNYSTWSHNGFFSWIRHRWDFTGN